MVYLQSRRYYVCNCLFDQIENSLDREPIRCCYERSRKKEIYEEKQGTYRQKNKRNSETLAVLRNTRIIVFMPLHIILMDCYLVFFSTSSSFYKYIILRASRKGV